jgi:hypothetical protein
VTDGAAESCVSSGNLQIGIADSRKEDTHQHFGVCLGTSDLFKEEVSMFDT